MTTENPNIDHNIILQGLHSADQNIVIEALDELKTSGKVEDIPVLVELLHTSSNPEIKTKITSLLANLKGIETIPLLISAIRNPKYAPELQKLVSSCWENGLDYSNYLSIFTDLLIENDFLVAFEAYTVITNLVSRIDQAKIETEIDRLDKALATAPEEKRPLLLDVIDFLPSIGI